MVFLIGAFGSTQVKETQVMLKGGIVLLIFAVTFHVLFPVMMPLALGVFIISYIREGLLILTESTNGHSV